MSASLGVSGPNEPEILIRHRGAMREGGSGRAGGGTEGPAGLSVASGSAVFILHAPMAHMVWVRPEW